MPSVTPPFKAHPSWTTSRFFSFVRSALRSAFRKWPPKWEAVADAKRVVPEEERKRRNIRHRYEYQCAECNKYYTNSQVEVDHIEPVGSLKTYDDLPKFVERMFCSKAGLRVVCKQCHRSITNAARGTTKKTAKTTKKRSVTKKRNK